MKEIPFDGPEVDAAKEAFVQFIITHYVAFVTLVDAWSLLNRHSITA